MSLRAVIVCDGCNDAEATTEFTEHGRVISRKCQPCADGVIEVLARTAKMIGSGVPAERALDWALESLKGDE